MKSRDTVIRLKRFQVEEKRRRVRQIEMMTAEFTRMTTELDREIALEEKRAGIRRDNLKSSIAELMIQHQEAKGALDDAQAELQKYESIEGREKTAERASEASARL